MSEKISDNEVLNSYNNLIPYLPEFFEDEVIFTIADTDKFLRVVESQNIKLNAVEGDPLRPGGAAYECLKAGHPIHIVVSGSIFGSGSDFKATGIPIRDESGKLAGCIVMGRSLDRQNQILKHSKDLSAALTSLSSAISQISSGAQELLSTNQRILDNVNEASSEAKNTDDIIQFVKSVAEQTNLLGLNAAIEAARAGENGRGFNIVAQEIRKLSGSSSQSIDKVEGILNNVKASVEGVSKEVNEVSQVFRNQAAALQQMTASIEELKKTAKALEDLAEKV